MKQVDVIESKQERFQKIWKSGRTANPWFVLPEKAALQAVEDVNVDSDGYWIYLKEGWKAYDGASDCGIIHEYNVNDLKKAIKTIRRKTNEVGT